MKKQRIDQLKKIPLFSKVGDDELELIADSLATEVIGAGTQIIREGDEGNSFYIIKEGTVKVCARIEDENEEIILTRLKTGDHFGEMALISGEPRSASIYATTDVVLWKLDKKVFDDLILHNPGITLTLTHLLTQRLKSANIARKETEAFYHKRFMPGGTLNDLGVIQLLKYAEENSLSGKIMIFSGEEEAAFIYKKGILEHVRYKDLEEDDALDKILDWTEGTFRVEPESLQPTVTTETIAAEPPGDVTAEKTHKAFKRYLELKLRAFIHFAGPKITQRAINYAYHTHSAYFKNISRVSIQTHPEYKINIGEGPWPEKDILMMAIILREVVSLIEREMVGFEFWSPLCGEAETDAYLSHLQFFDYFEQAMDFTR
ncbi:MAG TPA: cyclic nucleotide-binding domain-containing protein [Caldithrix abyssi]|uniref:Cyclic nucleotide-binding domain-containing protein n=1 Tax=Caldithrix abyssi TaxID=187145 RepID=A0A7V5RMZ5_CALAY|nr:cyclic nucleotide-binding domain-containing protein [Caldithrix abyssi]